MDTWKFYDITHRDHVVCNPTSLAKLEEIVRLVDLPRGPRVLDIACGKGEMFLRLGETYGDAGGAEYLPNPGSFDFASCVAASWVFGGHSHTLRGLRDAVRPGGQAARWPGAGQRAVLA